MLLRRFVPNCIRIFIGRTVKKVNQLAYPESELILSYKTWQYQRDYFLKELRINLAIDAGANVGQWASQFRKSRPSAEIFSFEPDLRCKVILDELIKNEDNWKVRYVALGSENATKEMNLWDVEGGSSSLVPLNNFGESFTGWVDTDMDKTVVSVRKLSSEFDSEQIRNSSSILKIDVQGFEMEVLKGSEEILAEFAAIEIEIPLVELYVGSKSAGEIIIFIESFGFTLVSLATERWAYPGAADCDAFFVRTDLYRSIKTKGL